MSSAGPDSEIFTPPQSPASSSSAPTARERRPLQSLICAHDFEKAASENLSAKAWAFFSSAATDCVTQRANESYFDRIWLRPQILKDVKDIRCRTKMLGTTLDFPLFISPTAMVKLAHPDGEIVIAKGCAGSGIAQTV
jgi:L-lactate dehydrogenase (cytochrome)